MVAAEDKACTLRVEIPEYKDIIVEDAQAR